MLSRFTVSIFVLGFSLITIKPAAAQSFDSFTEFQEYIKEIVTQSMPIEPGEEMEIALLHLDQGMKLPSCQSPLKATLAQPGLSAPSNTVILNCPDQASVSPLYIPVQIKVMTDTLTAARRILPGEVLTDRDVLIQKNDKFQIYDEYFQDKSEVNGLVVSRLIPPGGILLKKSINKALFVKKNQSITLMLKHGPIEISMAGVAKTDGYLNDTIKVTNPSSQKIVDAQVIGPGKAEVNY